jgi:photosystem II stability/assembly factor-like uncharacterized protein
LPHAHSSRAPIVAALLAATIAFFPSHAPAQSDHELGAVKALKWRMIGPFRGGRSKAGTGVPARPGVFYMGATNGGVWKTNDYGRTWSPIFDDQPTQSIGAIEVSLSNPDIVYVGSGEGLQRPDLSTGDGIYKSTDAGKTWQHLGLRDGQQIPRIIVDPRNPNRLFVAVLGHPYGPNNERGVFRSLNGGTSFERVLYTDENTGAADLTFAPNNPNIVYAVMWESRQGPWENGRFQGPGSALYKSIDGGTTWKKLTKGLPVFATDGLGRIGIAVAPSNPNRLYATVESARLGGVYTSIDAGENWTRTTSDNRFYGRAEDFAAVTVDPKDENTIYTPNVVTWKSVDGGKTWNAFRGAPGGDDYQRLWISPTDSKVMLLISDQGGVVTVNGGETWSSWYNQPTAQFYHVTADNAFPYRLCGGQQESGSACVSSRGDDGSIGYREWHPVGVEEYGYVAPDPLNPDIVYGGKVQRFNRLTGQTQNVGPYALGTTLSGAAGYRVIRTMPILFSPVNPKKLYFASNVLWETVSGGQSWKQISPDLSRETWDVPKNVGKHAGTPAAAVTRRGVIYTVAPSPLDSNTIWAGTDDGLIHVTRNGGKAWTNVSPLRLSPWMKVSLMDASHFDANTAYAAVNTLRLDDLRPHIYRTRDGGKNWTEIVAGIDSGATINVVREDPKRRGLLFAGSERTVWYSLDDGDHWHSLRLNLPATSVRDLIIKDNDVAVGTHGRGFWILDDISALRQWTARAVTDSVTLFKPATGTRVRYSMYTDTPVPPDEPLAENPPDGVAIDYYFPRAVSGPITLDILTPAGRLVRRYSSNDLAEAPKDEGNWPAWWFRPPQVLSTGVGLQRFVWDLHYNNPPVANFELPISATPRNTVREPRGPWAQPGQYVAKLTVDGHAYTQPFDVRMDPRVKTPAAALLQQFTVSLSLFDAMHESEVRAATARVFVDSITARKAKATGDLAATLDAFAQKFTAVAATSGGGRGAAGGAGATPAESFGAMTGTLLPVMNVLQDADEVPTAQALRAADDRMRAMAALRTQWSALSTTELAAINAKLTASGLAPLRIVDVRTGTGYAGPIGGNQP